jgi:pimeloyl-ACP methyl ester carboxylesterase
MPRPVNGGHGKSTYSVATLEPVTLGEQRVIKVRGEQMATAKRWDCTGAVWFDIECELYVEDQGHLTRAMTFTARVALNEARDGFVVTVRDRVALAAGLARNTAAREAHAEPLPRPAQNRARRSGLRWMLAAVCVTVAAVAGLALWLWPWATPQPSLATGSSEYVGDRRPGAARAIVFVHGILGDAKATWTATNGAYWPQLIRQDDTFKADDVFVYDYASPLAASRFSIDELADNLRLALDSNSVFQSHKEVVFISHSMGGLVVRAFLLKYQSLKYPAQVPMIYFIATPTTGSELAQLAKLLLARNPQISDLLPWRDASYVGNLVRNWNAAKFSVRSYCAYEKQDVLGTRVVDEQSATHSCTERLDPMDRDHINIAKPASATDDPYLAVKTAYLETFKPVVSNPKTPGPKGATQSERGTSTPAAPSSSRPISEVVPNSVSLADCPAQATDRPPGVSLRPGDLVALDGRSMFRIDRRGREARILSSGFFEDARTMAVEPGGTVLVGTMACGRGLLVRVDPRMGTQTPIVGGFRSPQGLMVEAGGQTALVGDENSGGYGPSSRGALVRVNLSSGERSVLHRFFTSDTATGIVVHPVTGDLFFTARALYRLDARGGTAKQVDLDGIGNARALAITTKGDLYIGDSERSAVLKANLSDGSVTELAGNQGGLSGGWIGLAASVEGDVLFLGSSNGEVRTIPLVVGLVKPGEFWKGTQARLGLFVAMVH